MPIIDSRNENEITRCRAATYAFLAAALRYPDDDMRRALCDAGRLADWIAGIQTCLPRLVPASVAVEELLRDPGGGALQGAQETYIQLFGHAVRGACPPYELEYGKAEIIQQAGELADIRGFYHAFGLELVVSAHERPDHAGTECEFMSALCAKQAYAIENGNGEAVKTLRAAQASFLEQHLGRWGVSFARRLQDADTRGFYGRLGTLAGEFLRHECARFEVPCGPQYLELRAVDSRDDAMIECGVEERCPGAAPQSGPPFVQVKIDR